MPCITYVTKAFRPDSLVIIERPNQISTTTCGKDSS